MNYCFANECVIACGGFECGTDHGVDCGTCEGMTHCRNNRCIRARIYRDCGTDGGVDCGTCSEGLVCAAGAGVCVPEIRPANQDYFCKEGDVHACFDGWSEDWLEDCDETSYCSATCQPPLYVYRKGLRTCILQFVLRGDHEIVSQHQA